MKLRFQPRRRVRSGYALLEALVYIGLVILLLGAGCVALYRCIDNCVTMRRSAEDITTALHLGELWRADVRSAFGGVRVEDGPGEQTLHLRGARGVVAYRVAGATLVRRFGEGPWVRVLSNVKASTMEADHRQNVVAWRWELELQPRSKGSVKAPRIRPLFTFLAVPEQSPARTARVASEALPSPGEPAGLKTAGLIENR